MPLFSLPPATPPADLKLEDALQRETLFEEHPLSYTLAAEWFPQSGVMLTWPHEDTDWKPVLPEIEQTYLRLAWEIASRELLLIVTPEPERIARLLVRTMPQRVMEHIVFYPCPTNDTWARDHGALTLIGKKGAVIADFRFNGWGGKFPAERDNAITQNLVRARLLQGSYADNLDFEMEGGSIESDGQGTLLTTSACLLRRNGLSEKKQVEEELGKRLGAKRVLWLDHGELAGDDTDGHVDMLARFCSPDTIAYCACSQTHDPHYAGLKQMERELSAFRTASGTPYNLIPLPLPDPVTAEGERLPATYANFLILNEAILLPAHAQPAKDEMATRALQKAFPTRSIVSIDARTLLRQHGSIHCAAMQFPRSVLRKPPIKR